MSGTIPFLSNCFASVSLRVAAVAEQEETQIIYRHRLQTIYYREQYPGEVTSAVVAIGPRTPHLLRSDVAAGTCLKGTHCCNLKDIQSWMSVTKLYAPIFAVVTRWFYGSKRIAGSGWPLTQPGKGKGARGGGNRAPNSTECS